MMNVYQSQAKTKSFNNTDMLAKAVLKSRFVHRLSNTFFLQGIIHNNTFNALYILNSFVYKHITKLIQIGHENLYNSLCQ